jgi:hypothetical protein
MICNMGASLYDLINVYKPVASNIGIVDGPVEYLTARTTTAAPTVQIRMNERFGICPRPVLCNCLRLKYPALSPGAMWPEHHSREEIAKQSN